MKDVENLFIYTKFAFWVVLGMIFYLSGCFFIYIYSSQLSQQEIQKYWIFTNVFSVLKNVLFAIGIIVNAFTPKKQHSLKSKQNAFESTLEI